MTRATQQEKQAALPDADTAYQILFDNVHQRVFFNKCASYGLVPHNEKEAAYMLQMAGRLRQAEEQEMLKEAQQAGNPFEAASYYLDEQLGQLGYPIKQASDYEEEMALKEAAAQLMAEPALYNSVLALKAEEAERFLHQQQGR